MHREHDPALFEELRLADRLAPRLVEVVEREIHTPIILATDERAGLVRARLVADVAVERLVEQASEVLVAERVEIPELEQLLAAVLADDLADVAVLVPHPEVDQVTGRPAGRGVE